MRTIPSCFCDKTLIKLIDNHIDDGFKSYSSLDDTDKEYITARCIELLGDDAANCLAESDNISKTLTHFTKFLRTADQNESYDLVQSMIKNATDYFTVKMNYLFEERLEEIEISQTYYRNIRTLTKEHGAAL